MDENDDKSQLTLQVRFKTKQEQYSIPDYPISVGAKVGSNELNEIVNRILRDDGRIEKQKKFDFLIGKEFLRGTLEELVLRYEISKDKDAEGEQTEEQAKAKIGVEEIIEIEYIESFPPPKPEDALMHDDWVSAIDVTEKWILSGCYDNTLHIWSTKGKHLETFGGHESPIKAVCWISVNESSALFASGSQDQTVRIYEWDFDLNKIFCKWICKGHERSVETVKSNTALSLVASASWDGQIKFWSTKDNDASKDLGAAALTPTTNEVRVPEMTLAAHKESVSAVTWSDTHELISVSWDHTIKLWDVQNGGMKQELAGQKAFLDVSWSPLNNTIITSSVDRHIRLYDPRSNEGSLVKSTFTSHNGWVSSVNWSTIDENLFISGSYDHLMKLWDRRSPRAPLYNMTGHTENILATSWANPLYMISGGSDNTLRVFKGSGSNK